LAVPVVVAVALVSAVGAANAGTSVANADARMTLDTAGAAPIAGRTFLLTVGVESLPLGFGEAFEFTATIRLPEGVTFVSTGRGVPTSFDCASAGRTVTCSSRHIGADLTSNVNLSLRAARAGPYTFGATVRIDGLSDTDASNNAAELTVTVGPAPPAATCTVPNVRGRTQAAARRAILAAGCRPGPIRATTSTTVPKGRVVRQTPAAGRRVARGTAVTVVVSRGP
jgi:hypothetical protein